MTIHFIPVRGSQRAACGRNVPLPRNRTMSAAATTCGRCCVTDAWRARKDREESPLMAVADAPISVEPTFTRTQVKHILDAIFDRAHEAAEDQGVCETYNDIMEEVETSVPSWYTVPPRKQSWSLSVTNSGRYTETMTKDDLIAAIKANPEEYVSIEAG